MGVSICYGIVTSSGTTFGSNKEFDFEHENRFYNKRDTDGVMPH